MACKNTCRLCPNFVVSTALTFDAGTDTLNITLPNNGYRRGDKVCIVVTQEIPEGTTLTALVNVTVEGSTFPLLRCNCSQVTAREISTRTKYSTCVVTNTVSGAFKLIGKSYLCCPDSLFALPITPVAADGGGA